VDPASRLEHGRRAYEQRAWTDAHESLAAADRESPLAAEDLELLATAAYMLGRDDEYVGVMERAHVALLDRGEPLRAARVAFWIAVNFALRGEMGATTGWLGRARRLVERQPGEFVERGYVVLASMFEHRAAGDYDAAMAATAEAAAIGEHFGDADLFALATEDRGALLIAIGRIAEGLRLLDEAMVAVTAGELSPMVSGFVYCGVISGCQAAHEPRRATEWTAALTRWCEQQPGLVSFTGTCLAHRAELMQLRGAWPDALAEARQAGERCARAGNARGAAEARYREGELHRLRGELAAAEDAYRDAHRGGCEPQPGLALLRLAQGNGQAAAAAIRRAVGETPGPARRVVLLPAEVEILLAVDDVDGAADACAALEELTRSWEGAMIEAVAGHARGAVELARGDARAALVPLRRAGDAWRELDAPYEAARTRVLAGLCCRVLGDEDTGALELEAARDAFGRLGAAPDVARVDAVIAPPATHGLTARELEVLRLVAAGRSNREIAELLVISEHTVARHLQNIYAKLRVSSRTAASAFAHSHDLV
jgi:DNA-binding CsgD family transcriptional regulator